MSAKKPELWELECKSVKFKAKKRAQKRQHERFCLGVGQHEGPKKVHAQLW
jgi:hypothetical protein